MEGVMFYWVLWFFWVYLTFIVNKQHPDRAKLSAVILMAVILANFHIQIGKFDLCAGGIFLLIGSYTHLNWGKFQAMVSFFMSSFIVTMAYVAFLLFEIFDPVWLLFKREWMMGICLGYLVCMLQRTLTGRLLAIISGTMQGEILYALILSKFNFPYPVGSLSYLDAWALTSVLLVGWSFIESAGVYLNSHFHFTHRGRQKSS